MESLTINVKQFDKELPLPRYAYPGDGAMDLRSRIDVAIAPGERMAIPTGIALEIPEGYGGLIIPRSGLAINKGITVVNGPGLIDSNYRGEIGAILLNTDKNKTFNINHGDRIAQIAIVKLPKISLNIVKEFNDTARSDGGFGSSGI